MFLCGFTLFVVCAPPVCFLRGLIVIYSVLRVF